jgi:hypothetical protein
MCTDERVQLLLFDRQERSTASAPDLAGRVPGGVGAANEQIASPRPDRRDSQEGIPARRGRSRRVVACNQLHKEGDLRERISAKEMAGDCRGLAQPINCTKEGGLP